MRSFRQSSLLFFSLFVTVWGISAYGQQVIAVAQSSSPTGVTESPASESTALQKSQSKSVQLSSECALDDRKTVQTVKNQKGKVVLVGNTYVLVTEGNNGTRFAACNLPDALKTDGKAILFSGEVKEIYPTERWAATPFKITAVTVLAEAGNTPAPAKTSIQSLPNGNYKFCSEPPSDSTGRDKNLIAGHCYVFGKTGNRLVGDFYDTKTLGEESVCVSGTLSNKIIRGEALESVGNIGRQSSPPNSSGATLVNWDKPGYLKVAKAIQVGKEVGGGRLIRYRSALLDLNGFYRHNPETKLPTRDCFKR